ncbi:unnamed protein product [Echinostoma caproni]|uniref:DNA-binding protein n=1 Tax=Echinostoma caproni TaxID=27848 RepID=A0A183AHJ1_9TREM|nr:unnamed protein product [Echinostoma caproni]
MGTMATIQQQLRKHALTAKELKRLVGTPWWPLQRPARVGQFTGSKPTETPSFAFANDMRLAMRHRRTRLRQFASG